MTIGFDSLIPTSPSSSPDNFLSINSFSKKTVTVAEFAKIFGFGSASEAKTALAMFKHIPEYPLLAGSSFQVDIDRCVSGNHVLDFLVVDSKGKALSVEFHPICLDREMKYNDLYRRFMDLTEKYKDKHVGRNGRLIQSEDHRIPDISSKMKALQKDICERYYIQKRANYVQNSNSSLVRESTFVLIKGEHELLKFINLWQPKLTKSEFENKSWSQKSVDLAEFFRTNARKHEFHANYQLAFDYQAVTKDKTRVINIFEERVLKTINQTLIGLNAEFGNRYTGRVAIDHRSPESYINFAPFHSLVVKPHEVNLARDIGQKLIVEDPFLKLGLARKARDIYTGQQIYARFESILGVLDKDDAAKFLDIQVELAKFTNYKRLRCSFSHSPFGNLPTNNFVHVANAEDLWNRVISPLAGPNINRNYFNQIWDYNQESREAVASV